MIHNIFRFTLVMGILIFILVGCSTEPTQSLPTDTAMPEPTSEPIAISTLPPTNTATTPAEDETPAIATEGVVDRLKFVIVSENSEARYRVQEQLAGFDLPNDAVGSTRAISGVVVIGLDGTIDPSESRIEVDLSTLTSDQSRRDNFLRNNTLRTNQFPLTVFVPENISGFPDELPESGEVAFTLVGNLTIMDVTRSVEWEVIGNLQDDIFRGQAFTSFTFDYFEIDQPRVASVLSIEDTIRLEVDFTLQRVDN